MCQALSEGGRRCPIHRDDVKGFLHNQINLINNKYSVFLPKINTKIAEELFINLRKTSDSKVTDIASYSEYYQAIGKENAMSEKDYEPVDFKTIYALASFNSNYDTAIRRAYEKFYDYGPTPSDESLVGAEKIQLFKKYFTQANVTLEEYKEVFFKAKKENEFSDLDNFNKRYYYAIYKTEAEAFKNLVFQDHHEYDVLFEKNINGIISKIAYNKQEKEFILYREVLNEHGEICDSTLIGTMKAKNALVALKIKNHFKKYLKVKPNNLDKGALHRIARSLNTNYELGHRQRIKVDTLGKSKITIQRQHCAHCGQFIGIEHICPPSALKELTIISGNDQLNNLFIEKNKNNKLFTNDSFTISSSNLDFSSLNRGVYDEVSIYDENEDICGSFSLLDYYLVENSSLGYSTFKKVEDTELVSIEVDPETIYYSVDELKKSAKEMDKTNYMPYEKASKKSNIKQIFNRTRLENLEINEFVVIDMELMTEGDFTGSIVFTKNKENEVTYDLDYIRGSTCDKCRLLRSLRGYCSHKAELRKELDQFIDSKNERYLSDREFLDSKIFNESNLFVDENNNQTMKLNEKNSHLHNQNTDDLSKNLMLTLLSKMNVANYSELTDENLTKIANQISLIESLDSRTCRKPNSFLQLNASFIEKNNIQNIRQNTFNFIKDGKNITTSYEEQRKSFEESTPFNIKNLKCNCNEYAEKYYCEHINMIEVVTMQTTIEDKNNDFHKEITEDLLQNIKSNSNLQNLQKFIDRKIEIEHKISTIGASINKYNEVINNIDKSYEDLADYIKSSKDYLSTVASKVAQEKINCVQFSQDMDSFESAYREGKRNKRNKKENIQYKTENVTNGICDPVKGAKKFGLEIEVVHDGERSSNEKRNAEEALIRDFKKAKLIPNDTQEIGEYGDNARKGYKTWSIEYDSTVELEIVSPPLYDAPECWEQIEVATYLLKKHGFTVNESCGGHVNISTQSFANHEHLEGDLEERTASDINSGKVLELKNTFDEHYEIFKRLGQDTNKGKHRGTGWAKPSFISFTEEIDGKKDILKEYRNGTIANRMNYGIFRENGINLTHMSSHNYLKVDEFKTLRAEYRIFDGSLEPEIIQQRIKLAAALTLDAETRSIKNNYVIKPKKHNFEAQRVMQSIDSYGEINEKFNSLTNRQKKLEDYLLEGKDGRTHTRESLETDSETTRSFIDKIFSREEDKNDIAKLYAITNWS